MEQPDPRPGGSLWRGVLTMASVITMLVLVSAVSCAERSDKESVDSLRRKSTTLRDKQKLRIGVRDDLPQVGYRDPSTNALSGFEIDLARALAEELGYREDRIEWVTVTDVPERIRAVQNDQVDMLVATVSITPPRAEKVSFAGPYLVVPQAVLIKREWADKVTAITDLRTLGLTVCVGAGSTAASTLAALQIPAHAVNNGKECVTGLKGDQYHAYVADLPILAARLAGNEADFTILDNVVVSDSSESIAVAVPKNDTALRDLIAYFLNRWKSGPQPSPWQRAYNQYLEPYLGAKYRSQPHVDNPPDLVDYDTKSGRG